MAKVTQQTKTTAEPKLQRSDGSTTEIQCINKSVYVPVDSMESLCKYQRFQLKAEDSYKIVICLQDLLLI